MSWYRCVTFILYLGFLRFSHLVSVRVELCRRGPLCKKISDIFWRPRRAYHSEGKFLIVRQLTTTWTIKPLMQVLQYLKRPLKSWTILVFPDSGRSLGFQVDSLYLEKNGSLLNYRKALRTAKCRVVWTFRSLCLKFLQWGHWLYLTDTTSLLTCWS